MFNYFFHNTIRQTIIGFGTIFKNIYVSRRDTTTAEIERIHVPISYGPKQKYIIRQDMSDPELVHKIEMTLPRMGYEIVGISYDPTRKLNSIQKSAFSGNTSSMSYRLEKVPYNLNLAMYVLTKNTDDSLQILEQILPYFTPDYNITFRDIGTLTDNADSSIDIPITMNAVNFSENYEGSFDDRKQSIILIDFMAKIWLYGPITESNVITQSTINFYDRYDIDNLILSPPGLTLESMIFTVTGGATAGNIGATGTIDTQIIEW